MEVRQGVAQLKVARTEARASSEKAEMTRTVRILGTTAAIVIAATLAAAAAVWMGIRGSLPVIDGTAPLAGLGAKVVIERDAAGVPTLTAQSRNDLARALGFVHGQDRYFQMDLLRRAAAGELSALLGPSLLATDRQLRLHRFRTVARAVVSGLDARERALLNAYVAGVNAGLASLQSRPFEYWLLRSRPQRWTAEDSILCIHAMYLQLQDAEGHAQLQRGLLRATLPQAVWAFLEAGAPEWDATVDGTRESEPRVPLAEEFNLREIRDLPTMPPEQVLRHLNLLGSNNWAVAGAHTANGAAIVANDMHLGFRVPNIWYRARLIQKNSPDSLDLTGVTLPGTPTAVAGSNGSIAWGFTNSYGEFATVIRLVAVASDAAAYQTAAGTRKIRYVDEAIEVAGAATEHLKIALTEWGPVVGNDWEGRPYALQWTAQDPTATNLNLLLLEQAQTVTEALRAAAIFGIPGQNFMVADKSGHIGWTIAGRLPGRRAAPSGVPQQSTDPAVGFAGWLPRENQPQIADPDAGFLWSANARVAGGTAVPLIGDDGMNRGSRAAQIQSDLQNAAQPFTPASSLAIQLDDRAVFLERWRTLLNDVVDRSRSAGLHDHDDAHDTLIAWSGHAAPQDPAYRLVGMFREQVEARAFFMLISPARLRAQDFHFLIPSSFEGPLWRLVQQRPVHLLPSRYADWDAFFLEALTASEVLPPGCHALVSCTWGQVNAVHIAHPMSGAVPSLASVLDMPTVTVAGGREDMPRIQGRDYGASERFSVSPGYEAEGYFHMPGAQSGHPLSPFYRAGFDDWAHGKPTPFLPGPAAYSLVLTP
jgi:penicillin amidase